MITVTATTHNPERAEFITVTGPKGTEHTYFYAAGDESTSSIILQQLGLNPAQPLCKAVEESLRAAMDVQRMADAACFQVTFTLDELLESRLELIHRAA